MLGLKGALGQRPVGKGEQGTRCVEEGGNGEGKDLKPQGAQQVGGRGRRGQSSGSGKCEKEGEDAEREDGCSVRPPRPVVKTAFYTEGKGDP